jgi:hypothetical protein
MLPIFSYGNPLDALWESNNANPTTHRSLRLIQAIHFQTRSLDYLYKLYQAHYDNTTEQIDVAEKQLALTIQLQLQQRKTTAQSRLEKRNYYLRKNKQIEKASLKEAKLPLKTQGREWSSPFSWCFKMQRHSAIVKTCLFVWTWKNYGGVGHRKRCCIERTCLD